MHRNKPNITYLLSEPSLRGCLVMAGPISGLTHTQTRGHRGTQTEAGKEFTRGPILTSDQRR